MELRFIDAGQYTLVGGIGSGRQLFGWYQFTPSWQLGSTRNLLDAPIAWCHERFAKNDWEIRGTIFMFLHQNDALEFKIRWVG